MPIGKKKKVRFVDRSDIKEVRMEKSKTAKLGSGIDREFKRKDKKKKLY